MSGPRRRHPDKDIEKVLREAETHRWKVIPGKTYWKARCPCGQHANWSIKLTPSGANYVKDLSKWFHRQGCWGD